MKARQYRINAPDFPEISIEEPSSAVCNTAPSEDDALIVPQLSRALIVINNSLESMSEIESPVIDENFPA